MTKKELTQLYYLDKEIKKDKERLEELETKATKTTQGITGMSFGGGTLNKVESFAVEIAEQRELIEEKVKRCIVLENRIYRFINTIDDSLTRQIFTERYIKLKPWLKIALDIGGDNTADSVRMIHNRFLKREKQRG